MLNGKGCWEWGHHQSVRYTCMKSLIDTSWTRDMRVQHTQSISRYLCSFLNLTQTLVWLKSYLAFKNDPTRTTEMSRPNTNIVISGRSSQILNTFSTTIIQPLKILPNHLVLFLNEGQIWVVNHSSKNILAIQDHRYL